jgi:uncharacterized protein (TIRG00374 family)
LTASRLLRIAVAASLTAYVVWNAEPGRVADAAARADGSWIAIAVVLVLVDRTLMAYRWIDLLCALTPGSRPPFGTVLRIFFVSTFVGTFLPSVGGDVYRAYSLASHNVRGSESAASVLMDRLLGVLSIVMLAVVALLLMPRFAGDPWISLSLLVASAGCVLASAMVFSSRTAGLVQSWAARLPSRAISRLVRSITDAVRRYSQYHGALARVLAMSLAVQVIRVVQAYCLGRAIGIDLGLAAYFVFIPLIVLVMQLPISVSGLGTGQAAADWLFGQAGVPSAEAVALSLLFIALGVVGNLPGAALYALGDWRRR